eukprot:358302-Chlamydomonas_euryale.AAC.4
MCCFVPAAARGQARRNGRGPRWRCCRRARAGGRGRQARRMEITQARAPRHSRARRRQPSATLAY